MMLGELIKGLEVREIVGMGGARPRLDLEIAGITQDSRKVEKGFLFVAIPGQIQNGHQFIPEAVKRGAVAVVVSQSLDRPLSVPQLVVQDPRRSLALLSARFWEDPSLKMTVVGITGTNGKTTLTYLLESILREAGRRPAVIGTIGTCYGEKRLAAETTTPESVDLHRLFSEMRSTGITDVVMEVSSHALALERVRGVHFDVGVFTNLSQDHLDFHRDLEEYFAAKLRLFCDYLPESRKGEKFAVVNMEDSRGEEVLKASPVRAVRSGLTGPYEVSCSSFQLSAEGIEARIIAKNFEAPTPGRTLVGGPAALRIRSSLLGRFNLENILLAIGVAEGLAVPPEAILRGIEKAKAPPGRLERIPNDRGILIFVDYAHTPEALARVGEELKRLTRGRLLTVFGCGGDRDRAKRPLMGRAAGRMSDLVIVTSDNPRTEDPEAILDEILPGLEKASFPCERLYRIPSREEALRKALDLARRGDTILVAGKGHEDYQIIGEKRIPFSDREVLKKLLQ